jgi:hypothetical protein
MQAELILGFLVLGVLLIIAHDLRKIMLLLERQAHRDRD